MTWLYIWLIIELLQVVANWKRIVYGKPILPRDRFYIAPAVIAGGVGAVTGLVQAGVGVAKKIKAARMAKSNIRPVLEDDPFTQEAYDLTSSKAGQGLSDSTMQAYTTNSDRALSASIDAILKSGGSANNISEMFEGSQSGLRNLALTNQNIEMQNLSNFLNNGLKPKADENRDQFHLNQYVPYMDRAALAATLSSEGMADISKGVNTAVGGAMSMINPYKSAAVGQQLPDTPIPAARVARVASAAGGNTSSIPLPVAGSSSINPALLSLQMIMNGYNTERPPGAARWNSITNRWE